jgi:transcriptional regulator with XRE-family HTH domain
MKLDDWQKRHGVSNHELATKAKIHESFLSKVKNGKRRFSYVTAHRVSKATDEEVSIGELLSP